MDIESLVAFPQRIEVNDRQRELASELAAIYAKHEVLRGTETPALHEACTPECGDCWKVARDRVPRSEHAGIVLPWVGPEYRREGVVVAGMNLPVPDDAGDFGGFFSQWWVWGNLGAEIGPSKHYKGTEFGYGTAAFLLALEAAERGAAGLNTEPQTSEVIAAWNRCALLEVVKCSPVGGGSTPTQEMQGNCLGKYLIEELAVLRPRALIVLGLTWPAERVKLLQEASDWSDEVAKLRTGTLTIEGRSFPVYCCHHPSRPGWRNSLPPLFASVSKKAVNGPG